LPRKRKARDRAMKRRLARREKKERVIVRNQSIFFYMKIQKKTALRKACSSSTAPMASFGVRFASLVLSLSEPVDEVENLLQRRNQLPPVC